MSRKLLIVSFICIFSIVAFAQNKSVYSELTPDSCAAGDYDKSVPGHFYAVCKGVGGYDLEYYLDDERNSLGVVFPSKKVVPLNFWNYFRDFSELGPKAEWRLKGDRPVALIVRLDVSDREDETKKSSYLLVTRIEGETACVTNVVKPSGDQNAKARQLADKSNAKKCMAGFAGADEAENPELPAGIADWAGEGSDKLVSQPSINKRLQKLLGAENYEAFMGSFETLNAIERKGDVILGSGCMIRACTRLESALAVDLENKTIHAAIFNQIEETRYFNEKGAATPAALSEWARRLEDLKNADEKDDADDADETAETDGPEGMLLDEFPYGDREQLLLRLDNFANHLQDDPTAKGQVIIYGDKSSGAKASKEIKEHLELRGLDPARVVFLNKDSDTEDTLIRLWLVP